MSYWERVNKRRLCMTDYDRFREFLKCPDISYYEFNIGSSPDIIIKIPISEKKPDVVFTFAKNGNFKHIS